MKKKPSYKELESELITLTREIKKLDRTLYNIMEVRFNKQVLCLYCGKLVVECNSVNIPSAMDIMYKHVITCSENPLVKEIKILNGKLEIK